MNNRGSIQASLLAIAALLAGAPALADVKAGVDAWSRGDYAVAIREWKGPAEKGDADAQFNLGQAYKLGRGVSRDLAKAEELFGKAAAQGHLQASDNYGLLLFQRGEHARAMPFVAAASGRGDPRAQYILGLAHFNGDGVTKDWVRAYALVSLAQQAGLQQAIPALAQMDEHIPLDQRQQSIALAAQLAADAQASRRRQLASADLGGGYRPAGSSGVASSMSSPAITAPPAIPRMPVIASAERELAAASGNGGTPYSTPAPPASAAPGADFTQPARARPAAPVLTAQARPARAAAPAPAPAAIAAPARAASGPWRVQFGAFGVAGNAEALWARLRSRPELAGHGRILEPAGRLTKLQAGGFASQDEAQAACTRLAAAGFTCIPVRN
jgi:TPR repeat protein